jgi:phospholipase/carboxylesterase
MTDPHVGGEVLHAGAVLEEARGVVILLHGRGGSARDMLSLAGEFGMEGLAFLAPQAAGSSWYPQSFLAARERNEPWLGSALKKVQSVVEMALAAGVEREQIVVAGFSQGACLTTEFMATHPARYAGAIAWTGGLIGPLGSDVSHGGDLEGTPVLLSGGDPDPHVPWVRVEETAEVLTGMRARVTMRRYPGKMHTVNAEEVELARTLVEGSFREL